MIMDNNIFSVAEPSLAVEDVCEGVQLKDARQGTVNGIITAVTNLVTAIYNRYKSGISVT